MYFLICNYIVTHKNSIVNGFFENFYKKVVRINSPLNEQIKIKIDISRLNSPMIYLRQSFPS